MDKDSLFRVFINFDHAKAELAALKTDTLHYRTVIKVKNLQIEDYKMVVSNFENVIVPAQQELNYKLNKVLIATERKSRKDKFGNILKGFGAGLFFGGLLVLIN